MQYSILKQENQIKVKGSAYSVPESLRQEECILPCTTSDDCVVFQLPSAETLQKSVQLISEPQYLLYVYSIAKAAEVTESKSKGSLRFVLDPQYIFCEDGVIRGIVVPVQSGEVIECKSFFWNLMFVAAYEDKALPVIRELLGFIRTAHSLQPQDLIYFIEMCLLGKEVVALYAEKHMFGHSQQVHEDSYAVKNEEPLLQTGNDFSSFLSEFDQPMEYDEQEEEISAYEQNNDGSGRFAADFLLDAEDGISENMDDLLRQLDASGAPDDMIAEFRAADPELLREAFKDAMLPVSSESAKSEEDMDPQTDMSESVLQLDEIEVLDELFIKESEQKTDEKTESDVKPDDMDKEWSTEAVNVRPEQQDVSAEPVAEKTPASDGAVVQDQSEERGAAEMAADSDLYNESSAEKVQEKQPGILHIDADASKKEAPTGKPKQMQPQQEGLKHIQKQHTCAEKAVQGNIESNGRAKDQQQYFLVSSEGRSCPILKNPFTIGRLSQGVDLTVRDMYVSRTHAQIVQNSRGVYFMDIHPKNPSFLNEHPVEPGRPYLLQNDDQIRIGKTIYYFRCTSKNR